MHRQMYTDAETSPHTRTASVVRAQNHLTHSLKPTPLDFMHVYEVRPRKDHRGVDLISDVLPFGRLWYDTPDNAIGYAMHNSRSHDGVRTTARRFVKIVLTHFCGSWYKGVPPSRRLTACRRQLHSAQDSSNEKEIHITIRTCPP